MTKFRIALFIGGIGIFAGASLPFFPFFSGISDAQEFSREKNGALPAQNAPPTSVSRVVPTDATKNFAININGEKKNGESSAVAAPNSAPIPTSDDQNDASARANPLPLGRVRTEGRKNASVPAEAAPAASSASEPETRGAVVDADAGPEIPRVVRRDAFGENGVFCELSNGLQILLTRTTERRAVVRAFFPEGGVLGEREFAGSGIARLTAKLVAQGATSNRSAARSRATLNAWGTSARWETSAEGALFSLDVAAEELDVAIDWALDVALRSTFDEARFAAAARDARRRIAAAERDRETFVDALVARTVYRASPLREPNDGRLDLAERLTLDDVRRFYATRYSPDKAIFAIAGPIDENAVLAAIRLASRDARRGAAFGVGDVATEPRQVSRRDATAEFPGTTAELVLVWPTVSADDPDAPIFDAIAATLTGGANSRLTRRVVDGTLPALDVAATTTAPTRGGRGTFRLRATVAPENLAAVETTLVEEVGRLGAVPIDESESSAARKRLETSFLVRSADPAFALEASARALAATGDPDFNRRFFATSARVDPASIRRVASERLGDVYSRIAVVPRGATSAPPPAPEPVAPVFGGYSLGNGARTRTLISRDSPLIDVRIVAAAGSLVETPETAGSSELIGALLDKGSAKFSRADVAKYFDAIGAKFEVEVGRHTLAFGATVLKEDFAQTLAILLDAATSPTFDEADFRRARERLLEKRSAALGVPDGALFALFFESVPRESTYSIPPLGTRESLASATSSGLRRQWRRIFAPQNIVVGLSGNIGEDALETTNRLLGAIPSDPAFRPLNFDRKSAPMQAISRARLVRTIAEGNALLAAPIPSVAEREEIAALTVLQAVWSGANGDGLLDKNFDDFDGVCRKRVDLAIGPTPGYMSIWLTTAPEALPDAKRRVDATVATTINSLISEETCVAAKKQILSRLDGRYTSSKDRLKKTILDDLYRVAPENELERREELFRDAVRRTTPQDVARVAKKYWGSGLTVFDVVSPLPFPGVSVNFDEKAALTE